jgi:protein-disulfide isomerase
MTARKATTSLPLLLATLLLLAAPCEARKIKTDDDPAKGSAEAPLVLVEFGDLQCPACYQCARETLPAVEAAYVQTGKVRLVYLDLPLDFHPQAFAAAVAAQCAGRQGKFWEYHDEIFKHLRYSAEDFARYAETLGLDSNAFAACLDDPEVATGIREDIAQAKTLGVAATPTFLLARPKEGSDKLEVLETIRGGQPFETFQAIIDAHLGKR